MRCVIERNIGDMWLVDFFITGYYCGTESDPKFPLLSCFRETIFPILADLVGVDGKYKGYTPITQVDTDGPHKDAEFKKLVREHCGSKGWYWEPQVPQMPHINVLDLPIFPAMSRCHIKR